MKTKFDGIEISSPNKLLFPKDNITKLDVAEYYHKIAPLMLPFVKNRLISAIRCHSNIDEELFYKKHPTTEGDFVNKFMIDGDEYFYLKTKQEILFQVQMGTLEFHIWGSKIPNIDKPDLMVFDLDPSENVSLDKLKDGVTNLKAVLDQLYLKSFLKTSGGKGFHVVVPFSNSKNWSSFSEFSKQIALLLEARWPKLYTSNIRKSERDGKIFVDYLRNKKSATCAAPFSLRARKGAPISFPIGWNDLKDYAPNSVNIKNVESHLSKASAWNDFFAEKQIIK